MSERSGGGGGVVTKYINFPSHKKLCLAELAAVFKSESLKPPYDGVTADSLSSPFFLHFFSSLTPTYQNNFFARSLPLVFR